MRMGAEAGRHGGFTEQRQHRTPVGDPPRPSIRGDFNDAAAVDRIKHQFRNFWTERSTQDVPQRSLVTLDAPFHTWGSDPEHLVASCVSLSRGGGHGYTYSRRVSALVDGA